MLSRFCGERGIIAKNGSNTKSEFYIFKWRFRWSSRLIKMRHLKLMVSIKALYTCCNRPTRPIDPGERLDISFKYWFYTSPSNYFKMAKCQGFFFWIAFLENLQNQSFKLTHCIYKLTDVTTGNFPFYDKKNITIFLD